MNNDHEEEIKRIENLVKEYDPELSGDELRYAAKLALVFLRNGNEGTPDKTGIDWDNLPGPWNDKKTKKKKKTKVQSVEGSLRKILDFNVLSSGWHSKEAEHAARMGRNQILLCGRMFDGLLAERAKAAADEEDDPCDFDGWYPNFLPVEPDSIYDV